MQVNAKLLKGFVFSLPAVGLNETITLFCNSLAKEYELVFYNWESFPDVLSSAIRRKNYPICENGYKPNCVDRNTTYLQFGEILIDTSINLLLFLEKEVETEKPDFIIHSHLALWGKLLSIQFKIPAVCLFTTFVFNKKTLLPNYRTLYPKNGNETDVIQHLRIIKKLKLLLSMQKINDKLDIWDVLANKEKLNLVFIDKKLQPFSHKLSDEFEFVGWPRKKIKAQKHKDLIYVACGSIFKMDSSFFEICISCLKEIKSKSIIVVGKNAQNNLYANNTSHICVLAIANQKKVLQQARIFISHGGMASIQEAIQTFTPMIIIPLMAEHHVMGEVIQELGIGKILPYGLFSIETLTSTIEELNDNYKFYETNVKVIRKEFSSFKTIKKAKDFFTNHIDKVCSNN